MSSKGHTSILRCSNRADYRECTPALCSLSDYTCENHELKRVGSCKARFEVKWQDRKGFALFSRQPIASGALVIELVGGIIDNVKCNARKAQIFQHPSAPAAGAPHYFFAQLYTKPDFVIDHSKKSNLCRFVNHSCEPNSNLRQERRPLGPKDGPKDLQISFTPRNLCPDGHQKGISLLKLLS